MARTGFGSRFLLGQRNAGYFGRVVVTFFVLSIGFGVCAGATVAGLRGVAEVLDPAATMYRLRHSSRALPLRGPVRFSAPLQAQGDALPPICAVVHEHYVSGKNGGWRLDGSWSRSAGAVIAPALWVRVNEPVVFDPSDPLEVTGEQDAWFRTVLAGVPAGGRLRAHCVAPTPSTAPAAQAEPAAQLGLLSPARSGSALPTMLRPRARHHHSIALFR